MQNFASFFTLQMLIKFYSEQHKSPELNSMFNSGLLNYISFLYRHRNPKPNAKYYSLKKNKLYNPYLYAARTGVSAAYLSPRYTLPQRTRRTIQKQKLFPTFQIYTSFFLPQKNSQTVIVLFTRQMIYYNMLFRRRLTVFFAYPTAVTQYEELCVSHTVGLVYICPFQIFSSQISAVYFVTV